MVKTNNYLFVYGTLLSSDNEYAAFLKSNSVFYADGELNARMYDIGEYPGAVQSIKKGEIVYGCILEMNDTSAVLPIVDEYEGYGPGQIQPYEFVRELVEIRTDAGDICCWTYLYNLSIRGLPQITSGKYIVIG